jgi:hypothetical protein
MGGKQLKMFMSPREIMHEYQPWDADREVVGDIMDHDISDFGPKTFNSQGEMRPHGTEDRSGPTLGASQPWRHVDAQDARREKRSNIRRGILESDSQLWDRKADEASEGYQSNDGYMSNLTDSIAQQGVKQPVHLGTQFGSSGKPSVVGGHHRIAGAYDVAQDMLIPVLHHEGGIEAARHPSSGYKYR